MKKFKELRNESKYGDAMSSRLPSHLDDPRHEPVKPSEAYLKEKKKRELHFANKGDIRVNADKKAKIKADMDAAGSKRDYDDHYMEESVWESYRTKALEEARLHHPLKGHPYHHKSDEELHYIIKDAAEAERAIGSHDKKAMWKYGDQQNDAASILGYRQRGGKQIPHQIGQHRPEHVQEERTPHAGEVFVDPFDKSTIHSYHGAGAKEKRDAYAVYLRSIGSTVKSYSHADDKSYHVMRGHHVIEEMTERERASHKDRVGSTLDANYATKLDQAKKPGSALKKALSEDAPHAGHVMNFSDRMEHQFFGAEEARKDRDAYAKHLKSQGKKVKLGSLRNQILHGSYGHVYSVTHKRDLNESVGSVPNAAFNEDGNDPNYKPTRPERRRAITHPTKKELDREKKELEKDGDFRDQMKESWNVGDHVVPKIGPHKGEVHRVIHVHPTGHVNIKPEHATGRRNRYHLGAAKADPKDLEDAPGHGSKKLEEAWKDKSLTTCSAGMSFNDAVAHATKHGGRVTYGTASRKWHSLSPDDRDYDTSFAIDPQEAKRQGMAKSLLGSTSAHRLEEGADTVDNLTAAAKRFKTQVEADAYYKKHPKELNKKQSLGTRLPGLESKRYRNLAENPIVREAFEAAKAKKKGNDSFAGKDAKATDFKPNDFQEPKDLKSPGQQDPQQAPVQGQPPQFGGKDQKSPEKQSNAPKPEKKTDKLTVKGPGPEDAFQTEPTVAGLTTLVKA